MELYFVIKLVRPINNGKGFKHVYVQCFNFGDIYQYFLVRVGRTTHRSDLSTAQTMNDDVLESILF